MTTSAPSLGLSPLRRSLATIILLIATGCNVACLWIPFMTLTLGTSSTDYSVLTSAFMLWDSQLHILAILVIGFSIIFPFAKLSVLWSCVFWPQPSSWRLHLLELVERFGKWSMLDVFLVCILMALTSNQFFVGNAPLIGTPIFIIAIIFSMLAGEIISTGISQPHSPAVEVTPPPIGLLLLLGFSAVLLGCVISMPFLIIDDWLLRDNAYSIISLVPTLIKNGSISMAVVAVAFLILIPIWSWLATVHLWIRMRRGLCLNALTARVNLLRRWSMLDVFGLALGVFLIEGKTMMTTEVSYGALLLVLGLGCQSLIHSAIDYRLARRHDRNKSSTP